jgi:putative DNA primase/helicase
VIEMGPPPLEERTRVLERVLAAEGHEVDYDLVLQFADRYSDMRELLRAAEDSIGMHNTLVIEPEKGEPEVWPQPVDGALLLSGLTEAFSRYLALPNEAPTTLALWTLFAHAHEAFGYSPILAAVSPVKRAGKTRLFEVLYQLVPNPVFTSNLTPASIFRMGGEVDVQEAGWNSTRTRPAFTLLADEGDTWLKLRPELHGVINSGHTRRSAFVLRVTSERTAAYSTWFPKALALIDTGVNALPPTVLDRSILIPMQRRKSDEPVMHLRSDRNAEDLATLKSKCVRWARDHFTALREANVEMPERIGDRTADNWRPLITVGAVASVEWHERAKAACLVLTGNDDETEEIKVLLLGDIRNAFAEYANDRIPTTILLEILGALVERQWRRMLTSFKLSQLLRPFGVHPRPLWGSADGGEKKTLRGYFLSDFAEAFERYL